MRRHAATVFVLAVLVAVAVAFAETERLKLQPLTPSHRVAWQISRAPVQPPEQRAPAPKTPARKPIVAVR